MLPTKTKPKKPHHLGLTAAESMPHGPAAVAVLTARAEQLAAPTSEKNITKNWIKYIRFSLGNAEKYGISYDYAIEVMHQIKWTPLMCVPHYVAGIINRGGSLLTILDLSQLLFNKKTRETITPAYVIVVTDGDMTVGLLADTIEESDQYDPSTLDPPLPLTTIGKSNYFLGIAQGPTTIINIAAILKDPQLLVKKI